MFRISKISEIVAMGGALLALSANGSRVFAVELQNQNSPLVVTVGKSLVLDNAMNIQRISLANGDLAEAVAVNPREVLINGKLPGETSLIIWQQGGPRLLFDLTVKASTTKLENRTLADGPRPGRPGRQCLPGRRHGLRAGHGQRHVERRSGGKYGIDAGQSRQPAARDYAGRGAADSAARTLRRRGPLVHLKPGFNFFSLGATGTIGGISTQQYSPPTVSFDAKSALATVTNPLNLFVFRPDLNIGVDDRGFGSAQHPADSGRAES